MRGLIASILFGTSWATLASAQQLQFFEAEPNETCTAGTAITSSSGLGGGQLGGTSDIDYFRLTNWGTGRLELTLSPENTAYDGGSVRVRILDQAGAVLAGRKLLSDSQPVPLRAVLGSGTYCIRVDQFPGFTIFTKEYRLLPSFDASALSIDSVEREPNDNLGQAQAVLAAVINPLWAQLSSSADQDFFRIDTVGPTDLSVSVDVESRNYNGSTLKAWITNSAGAVLAGRVISSDQRGARFMYARLPNGGSAYVKLSRRDGFTVMDRYVSIVAGQSTAQGLREVEPNNTPGLDMLTAAGQLAGQLSSSSDTDYFDVPLRAGLAQFGIAPETSAYDGGVIVIQLQSSTGTVMSSRELTSDADPQSMNVTIPADGIYRLVARAKSGYQIFDKHYLVDVPVAFPASASLSVSVAGAGRVTSLPAGISCPGECLSTYAGGSRVTLDAAPDAGAEFAGWSGACSGAGVCQVLLAESKSVIATFATSVRTLAVSVQGHGRVTSTPAGIACPSACSQGFANGTQVSLTAAAPEGMKFTGWAGSCAGVATACRLDMAADRQVVANFAPLFVFADGFEG